MTRAKYQFDLAGLQNLAARNYAALVRLLPEQVEQGRARVIEVSQKLWFKLAIAENAPYTTTVKIQQQDSGWATQHGIAAHIEVRLYHDAKLAEVTQSNGFERFESYYSQPNPRMHQVDEKRQANRFLAEWLQLCLQHGQAPVAWQPG